MNLIKPYCNIPFDEHMSDNSLELSKTCSPVGTNDVLDRM
jgi:hypothetical protein